MSFTTPHTKLPLIAPAQAQKHVTHNEALHALDSILHLAVVDRDLAAPPASPNEGDRYLIAGSASGDWENKTGQITIWQSGHWVFYTPNPGWVCWVQDENLFIANDGTEWTEIGSGASGQLEILGINATADTTNRFTVASDAVLMTHAGDDVRVKVNKSASTDTASFLFQSAWIGHAEIGLTGNNDFHFKVSADGNTFIPGLVIDHTHGTLHTGREHQCYFGYKAGELSQNTDTDMTAFGRLAAYQNTGAFSSFMGSLSGYQNNGIACTGLGYQALRGNTGSYSVVLGFNAGFLNTSPYLTSVGYYAGLNNTGVSPATFGAYAGSNNTGNYLSAFGYSAGKDNSAVAVCNLGYACGLDNSGDGQVAQGYYAGRGNTGHYQTAIGYLSGQNNNGNYTVSIGAYAGETNSAIGQTSIGYLANRNNSHAYSTAIGYNANNTKPNQIMLGSTTVTEVYSSGAFVSEKWFRPKSYTVATAPSAGTAGAGAIIYISNESGGGVPAFSDGMNWLRMTDRAIIS